MAEKIKTKNSGFTLIELMVVILLASIVFLGVGVVLADGIRGFRGMLTRVHGPVVTDAYVARIKFDRICRKARAGRAVVDGSSAPSLQVLYYSVPNEDDDADLEPNMYAEFYLIGTDLMLNTGDYNADTEETTLTGTETVANNVVELIFSETPSKGVQMVLTLDDPDSNYSMTVTCGAIMHN